MAHSEMDLEQAEGWRPEPGDTIIGKVTSIDRGYSDYLKDYYPILTIQLDTGDAVAVHCFQTVLMRLVLDNQPAVGSTVGIKFHGKRPTKGDPNMEVAVYTFRVQGASANPYAAFGRPTPSPAVQQEALPVDTSDDDIPF